MEADISTLRETGHFYFALTTAARRAFRVRWGLFGWRTHGTPYTRARNRERQQQGNHEKTAIRCSGLGL
jgi:hypothetical protein